MNASTDYAASAPVLSSDERDECGETSAEETFLLLGAGFSTRNRGVWALASGTITAILHAYPNARIVLLDYGKEPRTYRIQHGPVKKSVELLNIRYSSKFYLKNNIVRLLFLATCLRLVPSMPMRSRLSARDPYLNEISKAHVISSIAGGDSFSDIYGLDRFLYVSLPQVLVLLLGKPLILLPQTLGPFRGALAKAISGFIMHSAKIVYARDRESFTDIGLEENRRPAKFLVGYDMAFALEPIAPLEDPLEHLPKSDPKRPLVGLNVSGLLYMGGYDHQNMFRLKGDYRQLVHSLVHYFVERGANVLLIPHVYGSGPLCESDLIALETVHRHLADTAGGRLHLLRAEYNHHELKYLIGQCDFFLGSRMHACIAALSQGVPAVGLAYTRKFRGVFASIDAQDLVVDLTSHSEAEVIVEAGRHFENRLILQKALAQRAPAVRENVLGLFSRLASHFPRELAMSGSNGSEDKILRQG